MLVLNNVLRFIIKNDQKERVKVGGVKVTDVVNQVINDLLRLKKSGGEFKSF